MTAKKTKELPETPLQSEELRAKIVANSAAGGESAIGNERKRLQQEEDDEKFDGPGGSELPIAGGDPEPESPQHEAPAPRGAQAQPSNLTTNGSLPVNMVASPSGLVPVSAVTSDPHEAARLVKANLDMTEKAVLKSGADKLSRSKIESMTAGDLRAVAHDRGYDIGEGGGTRTVRRKFIALQQADDDAADDADDAGMAEEQP